MHRRRRRAPTASSRSPRALTAARRKRLEDHIAELVPSWSLAWLVEALQALRGYRLINAVTVAAGNPVP